MVIDSHCHLDLLAEHFDITQLLEDAKKAGVSHVMTIATDVGNFDNIINYTDTYSNVYAAIGVHPLNVTNQIIEYDTLVDALSHPKAIATGETGLDYYKNQNEKADQIKSLEVHIRASQELDIPIVIHTRAADDDTIDILKSHYKERPFRGVIHCFTATERLAMEMLDIGFYISASGIATFKNTIDIQNTLKKVPLSRLLVETDAPYLAPTPYRGKTNKPEYVMETAKYLANLRDEDFIAFCEATTQNFYTLFDKGAA